MSDAIVVLAASLGTITVLMTLTALWSRRVGKVAVVDVTWGLMFAGVALVCFLLDRDRLGLLLLALTAVWGLRLATHVLRRSRGAGEDPRYAKMLADGGFGLAVRKVFLVQGLVASVISLPLQGAAVASGVWSWWLVALGVVIWAVGLFFEIVGDAQLARYMAQPRESRPQVMDQGLWGWTRHPNYFGDACVWWGLWVAGGLASGWLTGLLTVVAPIAMTHFIRNVTGAKLLEQTMAQRPGWDDYAERVPLFVPRPPRR